MVAAFRFLTTDSKPLIEAATDFFISAISYSSLISLSSLTNSTRAVLFSRVSTSFLSIAFRSVSKLFKDLVGKPSSAETCFRPGLEPTQNSPIWLLAKNSSVFFPAVSLK